MFTVELLTTFCLLFQTLLETKLQLEDQIRRTKEIERQRDEVSFFPQTMFIETNRHFHDSGHHSTANCTTRVGERSPNKKSQPDWIFLPEVSFVATDRPVFLLS